MKGVKLILRGSKVVRTNQDMPNHCGNRITVTGDYKDRDAFVQKVQSDVKGKEPILLDFNKIIPEPEDNKGWFMWRNANWGTKWGSYDVKLKHNQEETVYTFLTAWGPPNNTLMEAMQDQIPNVKLDLRYAERGCEFYGYWTNEKNECWPFQNDDIEDVYASEDSDCEEPVDYVLRDGLKLYADLYEMSG